MERPLPVGGRTVFLGFTTPKDSDLEWEWDTKDILGDVERNELDRRVRAGSCDNEKASLAGRAMSCVQVCWFFLRVWPVVVGVRQQQRSSTR